MYIIGKSAIKKIPLISKAQICPNIEIQLLNEYVGQNRCNRELLNVIKSVPDANILAIHTPIVNKLSLNIEEIESPNTYFNLMETVSLANMVGEYENKPIKVICHTAFSYPLYKAFPSILNRIELVVHKILSEYPRVTLCIENVIPCENNNNGLIFRNGCLYDNVLLVKHLQELFSNSERIKTVLDTCHLVTTTRTLDLIFKNTYPDISNNISIESFFKENKDVIGLIHLADVKNLGLSNGEHGIKFEQERLSEMKTLIDLYYKYNYDCDITIEIVEDDYTINNNFKQNYEDLKSIINAHNNITE